MDIFSFLDKLLSSSIVEKHIGLVFIAVIVILANILNIDINTLKNIEYAPLIISFIVLIFNVICLPSLFNKMSTLNNTVNKYIEITSDNFAKEEFEAMVNKLNSLVSNTKNVQNSIIAINNQLKGIPNINTLNLILTLRSKELWNDMFRECIKSVTNYKKGDDSDSFNAILINTLKIELQKEKDKYVSFFIERLNELPENQELIDKLNETIDTSIDTIMTQIDKNVNDNNKLFLVSLTLQNLERDLIDNTTNYLRSVQVFSNN